MDLKKIVGAVTKDKLLSSAANKIVPMEGDKPKLGWKAKAAGVFAAIAAIAGMLSQYLSG